MGWDESGLSCEYITHRVSSCVVMYCIIVPVNSWKPAFAPPRAYMCLEADTLNMALLSAEAGLVFSVPPEKASCLGAGSHLNSGDGGGLRSQASSPEFCVPGQPRLWVCSFPGLFTEALAASELSFSTWSIFYCFGNLHRKPCLGFVIADSVGVLGGFLKRLSFLKKLQVHSPSYETLAFRCTSTFGFRKVSIPVGCCLCGEACEYAHEVAQRPGKQPQINLGRVLQPTYSEGFHLGELFRI